MKKHICLLTFIICVSAVFAGCTWFGDVGRVIIDTTNVKTELNYNEDLDLNGLIVKAKKGNSVITLTRGSNESSNRVYTVDYGGFDKTVSGSYTITISYEDYLSASFVVTVAKEVDRINVAGEFRSNYILNEKIDLSGGILQITFVDGSVGEISLLHSDVVVGQYSFASAGIKNIDIFYLGKFCSFNVTVYDVQLTAMSVVAPTKVEYRLGEDLLLDGGKILLNYSNLSADVPQDIVPNQVEFTNKDVVVEGFDSATSGVKVITVKYLGLQGTFNVTIVEPTILSVTLIKPTKISYKLSEELDVSGGKLQIVYDYIANEQMTPASVDLTDEGVEITGFSSEVAGECEVIVRYKGFECNFQVEIMAKLLTGITVHGINKTIYQLGESLDLTNAYILTLYNYGEGEKILLNGNYSSYGVEIVGFDSESAGEKTVKVSYKDKYVTFIVDVWDKDENEYICGFKVNNESIDINETDYLEFKDDVEFVNISVTVGKEYILVFGGENANVNSHSGKLVYSCCDGEIGQACKSSSDGKHLGYLKWSCCGAKENELDCVNATEVTFTKRIQFSHYLQTGKDVKILVYNRQQYMQKGMEADLVYSKNLGLYTYSYINSLFVNGVEFIRATNDTYCAKNGELVVPKKSNKFSVELPENYVSYIRKDSGGSSIGNAFEKECRLIIDVIYQEVFEEDEFINEETIQSFYIDVKCDDSIFEDVLSEMTINGQTLYSKIVNLNSGTEEIFIDLGAYNGIYTMEMYVDGQLRNYVSGTDYGHYYVNEGKNVFTLRLTGEENELLFKFVVMVGDVNVFACDYISSLKVVDVEAEYDMLEDKYIVHKPISTKIDLSDFTVVFEDGYVGYSFTTKYKPLSSNNRIILSILDEKQTVVHKTEIEIVNFDVGVSSTEFVAVVMDKTEDNNAMAMNFLSFNAQGVAVISDCLEGTPIQLSFIYDYTRYSVSSNCIGLADKNGKNFTAFLVNSGTGSNYITINVESQSGVTKTYKINVVFNTQPYVSIKIGNKSYSFYGSDIINGSGLFELVASGGDKYYKLTVPKGVATISSTKNTVISFTTNSDIGFYATYSKNGGLVQSAENVNVVLDKNNSFTLYIGYCADVDDDGEVSKFYNNAIKLVIFYSV